MKSLKNITLALLISLIFQTSLFADNDCPMSEWYPNLDIPSDFTGGLYKPFRTDSAGGQALPTTASFNVLIVFVQFPDENSLTDNSYWPIGQPPVIIDSLLAPARNNSGAFWNRYNESSQRLSDYYQEVSRGQFHMTGITRHYIFDHNRSYYNGNATLMNNEVYTKLKADTAIQWPNFDKWHYLSSGNFSYQGDGHLDMLMMVRRTNPGHAGFALLDGSEFEIDPNNEIWIRTGFYGNGSGLVILGNLGNPVQPHSYNRFLGILIHEYGHYLYGPHSSIGIMTSRGGNSIHDLFYSPFEKYKLGYIEPTLVNFSQQSSYSINDISSRTSNNNVLKVPISSNEYFLIENRRKVSKWDVKMLGDTAHLDMFRNTSNYGKGVYIYHHRSTDLGYPGDQDQECADGIWNWVESGSAIPDWTSSGSIPLIKRTSLAYPVNNDNGLWGNLNNKDGISVNSLVGGNYGVGVYFSSGNSNDTIGRTGTDKIFTNEESLWTSREQFGDRYDAWNIGYNQIFSPYSNPNTKDWLDDSTGIFIYYESLTSEVANLKIYKTGSGYSENEILAVTPPSRPMGINLQNYFPKNSNFCHPKIVWNHNTEPDMTRTNDTKRYKIFRAKQPNMNSVPNNYLYLGYKDVHKDSIPSYVDLTINKYDCGAEPEPTSELFPVRYYVRAVDKFDDESVPSDFVQTIGISGGPPVEDNFGNTT
ncbi:MAG TPA: hypothetical protein PKA90_16745 [Ignavibacteria bacterium]|nr:hypothetical protein [Ignavibacteria bacterium]HMR42066.1 hypothetical protein [Ignavibacteria bacterium]